MFASLPLLFVLSLQLTCSLVPNYFLFRLVQKPHSILYTTIVRESLPASQPSEYFILLPTHPQLEPSVAPRCLEN